MTFFKCATNIKCSIKYTYICISIITKSPFALNIYYSNITMIIRDTCIIL